jgi:hypothetical protein
MSNFVFLHPFANEVYYLNPSNNAVNILWNGGPSSPSASNVMLSLVDLGTTKNPNPYGQVLFPITGPITQPSPGTGMCVWTVPLNYAFDPTHFYVVYIQNAPGPATQFVYSGPFSILPAATVPAPGAGLGSNSNYIFSSGCGPILDLAITIDVAEDIVCQSANGPTTGFGFQLNAYSTPGLTCAYQQYIVAVFGSEIIGGIDNWPIDGTNLINDFFNLASTTLNTLRAGYKVQILLQNDTLGNVTSVLFTAVDNNGNFVGQASQTLALLPNVLTSYLAPISAFELDFVGPINGETAVLSSGAGTITYSSSTILTVLSQEPTCTETTSVTAEQTNSFYGQLPAAPANGFSQSFLSLSADVAPMIHKHGRRRPGLILPPGYRSK